MDRDTVTRSKGRKAGFIATMFRHRCTSENYHALCTNCKRTIRLGDSQAMRATKRIEWLKQEYREETRPLYRQGILMTALQYMRERVSGTHSDFSTSYFSYKVYNGIASVKCY